MEIRTREFLGLPAAETVEQAIWPALLQARRVALPRGALSRTDASRSIADFVAGLEGYTYLVGTCRPEPSAPQRAARIRLGCSPRRSSRR